MTDSTPGTSRRFTTLGNHCSQQWKLRGWTLALHGTVDNQAIMPLLETVMSVAVGQIERLLASLELSIEQGRLIVGANSRSSINDGHLAVDIELPARSKRTDLGAITLEVTLRAPAGEKQQEARDDDGMLPKLEAALIWAMEYETVLPALVNMYLTAVLVGEKPPGAFYDDGSPTELGIRAGAFPQLSDPFSEKGVPGGRFDLHRLGRIALGGDLFGSEYHGDALLARDPAGLHTDEYFGAQPPGPFRLTTPEPVSDTAEGVTSTEFDVEDDGTAEQRDE